MGLKRAKGKKKFSELSIFEKWVSRSRTARANKRIITRYDTATLLNAITNCRINPIGDEATLRDRLLRYRLLSVCPHYLVEWDPQVDQVEGVEPIDPGDSIINMTAMEIRERKHQKRQARLDHPDSASDSSSDTDVEYMPLRPTRTRLQSPENLLHDLDSPASTSRPGTSAHAATKPVNLDLPHVNRDSQRFSHHKEQNNQSQGATAVPNNTQRPPHPADPTFWANCVSEPEDVGENDSDREEDGHTTSYGTHHPPNSRTARTLQNCTFSTAYAKDTHNAHFSYNTFTQPKGHSTNRQNTKFQNGNSDFQRENFAQYEQAPPRRSQANHEENWQYTQNNNENGAYRDYPENQRRSNMHNTNRDSQNQRYYTSGQNTQNRTRFAESNNERSSREDYERLRRMKSRLREDSDTESDSDLEAITPADAMNNMRYIKSLESWGITYQGNDRDMPAEEFLSKLKNFRYATRISDKNLFCVLPRVLKGNAYSWYCNCPNVAYSWSTFKTCFREQYIGTTNRVKLMRELRARTQGKGEKISDFIASLYIIIRQFGRNPPSLDDQLDIACDNLRPEYRNFMEDKHAMIDSFETLRKWGRALERRKEKNSLWSPPPSKDQSYVPAAAFTPRK